MILFDTHAHLDSPRFGGDLTEVISRAFEAGIGMIVTVGGDLPSSRAAVEIAQQHPGVCAAVGVHPHEADHASQADLVELARLGEHAAVVAIGEIGLDFYRNLSAAEKQREVFVAQLELARELDKPVVVHDREAHAETMSILRDKAQGLKGVLHCFSGDRSMAEQAREMGFCVSFAGPVTFQNARTLQQLVREWPLDCMLIETDCPYLAPHPHRGRRNEPAYVRLVASKVAELKGVPLELVAEVTTANATRLFGLAAMS